MTRVRRALLFTSADRYTTLVVNFALVASVSRLLSPAEIGVSVLGTTILGIIEVLRDVPSAYLVQEKQLTRDDVATAFTCMVLLSAALGIVLFLSPWLLGHWLVDPRLGPYCRWLAIGLLPGPVERTVTALLRRDMAFDRLAVISIASVAVNAAVTIGCALAGFGFMSFAWAGLAANATAAVLALRCQRDGTIFRPSLAKWRRALTLAGYSSAWGLVSRIPEWTSYLLLGRLIQIDAVGLYNRARTVNELPGKLLLSGLAPVVFPALAAEARAGRDVAQPYLMALTVASALHWPAFLLLALLAHPVVAVLLGAQWLGITPLVRIIAIAYLFQAPRTLTQPTLMAVGAFRDLLAAALVALPIGLLLTCVGAGFGLKALAWALVLKVPLDVTVDLVFIRRHVAFTWVAFFLALRQSAVIAVSTAAAPAVIVAAAGTASTVFILTTTLPLAALGWVASVRLTGHPLAHEIDLAAASLWHGFLPALGQKFLRRNTARRPG